MKAWGFSWALEPSFFNLSLVAPALAWIWRERENWI